MARVAQRTGKPWHSRSVRSVERCERRRKSTAQRLLCVLRAPARAERTKTESAGSSLLPAATTERALLARPDSLDLCNKLSKWRAMIALDEVARNDHRWIPIPGQARNKGSAFRLRSRGYKVDAGPEDSG